MCVWSVLSAEYHGSTNRAWLPILLVVSSEQYKMIFLLSPFAPEKMVSRDGSGRPAPPPSACSFSILGLNLVLTRGASLSLSATASIYLFIPSTAIGRSESRVYRDTQIAYRWRSLPRVRRRRASRAQASSS